MYSNEEQQQENILESANLTQRKSNKSSAPPPFIDNRPETQAYGALQKMADNSKQHEETAQLQKMANDHADQQQSSMPKPNNTGLPDHLKAGIENLSGYSMDDVKVHYNSDKPAQLQAHAYAQGTDIHIGSGQEKHLPHEAWHVVQQKQGRVKPTVQMKGGVDVNDDTGLEREADVMGAKALAGKGNALVSNMKEAGVGGDKTVQRRVIFEGNAEKYDPDNPIPGAFYPLLYKAQVYMLNNRKYTNYTVKEDEANNKEEGVGKIVVTNGKFDRETNVITVSKIQGGDAHKDDNWYKAFNSKIATIAHEMQHALDLTPKDGLKGKNPEAKIDIEGHYKEGTFPKDLNLIDAKSIKASESVFHTEWRAWAIQAAVTHEQICGMGKVSDNDAGMFDAFWGAFLEKDSDKGVASLTTNPAFIKKNKSYLDTYLPHYKKNVLYKKTINMGLLDPDGKDNSKDEEGRYKHFMHTKKDWLVESIELFRNSITAAKVGNYFAQNPNAADDVIREMNKPKPSFGNNKPQDEYGIGDEHDYEYENKIPRG